jgi:hypothetical protein
MKPIVFSLIVSLLFFAGCKKEESKISDNDISFTEKKSTKYLKVGNTWVYRRFDSQQISDFRFDTIYISNSFSDENGVEVFEFRIKKVKLSNNGEETYIDTILGLASDKYDNVFFWGGYYFPVSIKNNGEYLVINKKGGGDDEECYSTYFKFPNESTPVKYKFNNKEINAKLDTKESYCLDKPKTPAYVKDVFYADGIGYLKNETKYMKNGIVFRTITIELVYFSELQ